MKRDIPHISGNPNIRSYIPTDKTDIPPDNQTNPNDTFHNKVIEFNPNNAKPLPPVVVDRFPEMATITNGYDLQSLEKYAIIGGGVLLLLLVLLKI